MTNQQLLIEYNAQKEIIKSHEETINLLKFQLNELKKLIFESQRERFISDVDADQLSLFSKKEEQEDKTETQPTTEKISYERKKGKNHPGRNEFPAHLPTQDIIIEPDEDTTGMEKIGEQITQYVDYTPGSLVVKRIIRPKYARPNEQGILIGILPSRPIEKSIAGSGLIAHILVSKFVDHMPFYRQGVRFKRDYQWELSASTINDWFIAVCTLLQPIYQKIKDEVLSSGYVQADESGIKVQDKNKKGTTHQGYQWVYSSPEKKLTLFHYRKGRGKYGPREFLKDYQGYLQCDGYKVYDSFGDIPGISLVGCLVHARRYFYKASQNGNQQAAYALDIFQKIYIHEKQCRAYTNEKRKIYRDNHILSLLQEFKIWLDKQVDVLPKSPLGKAVRYTLKQWPKLIALMNSGRLELDNNLIENKIRSLALGRKNYLFAGSHAAAQRIAMMYTFFATCKAREVNPYDWLKNALDIIADHPINKIQELIPGYKKSVSS